MNASRRIVVFAAILMAGRFAFAQDATRTSAMPSAPHSSFEATDVFDAPLLAHRLSVRLDPVSAYVWGRLPAATQQALAATTATSSARMSAVVDALNVVVEGGSIYDSQRFAGVAIAPEVVALAAAAPQDEAALRLNRLLLESAYPRELRRSPPLQPVGPSVATDLADYAPGTTAHLRGGGFLAGETLSLQVLHADGTPDNGQDHAPWSVVAAGDGSFQSTWHVCTDDCLGSTLKLTVAGLASGRVATAIFTDAAGSPTYQQLKSFGTPSVGAEPLSRLLQGPGGALYGTASSGGSRGDGTIFKVNPDGSGFTVLQNFVNSTKGGDPVGGLILGTDGALYGTASSGGSGFGGTVYKLNSDGSGFTVLANLDGSTTGGVPEGGLVQGSDGALYGTASSGGSGGGGTLFKVNTDGSGFIVLFSFTANDMTTGSNPVGGLIQGTDGVLYGTASGGGASFDGTVFKVNRDGSGFAVVLNLDFFTYGSLPIAGLLQGVDGALYGTTNQGGSSNFGTVFRVNRDGSGPAKLVDFDGATTGSGPAGTLMQASDGMLYGTAVQGGSSGGGTAFKVKTDGTNFTVLENFDMATTGGNVIAGLTQGSDGKLYGAASQGGSASNSGTLFKLNTDATGFAVLVNFYYAPGASPDGANPFGGVTQGSDGVLYGTAFQGGSGGFGAVYKMNPDGSGFTVLKSFDDVTTGRLLNAGLIQGTDGALYGTATQGGSGDAGTVFKLNTDGSGFTVLKHFDAVDLLTGSNATGANPQAALMQGTGGVLYGTTQQGGSGGLGTVFKLNSNGSGFTVLHHFVDPALGANPFGALTQGSDGVLYGTTSFGGNSLGDSFGTVFKLNTDGSNFAVLENFDFTTAGAFPNAGVIQGTDGALYGTTAQGGSGGVGTLFKVNTDGSGFVALQHFDNATSGAFPQAALMQGSDGALYGTAITGGSHGGGTAFKVNRDGSGFTVLLDFDDATSGSFPYAGLIEGSDGSFYGTTTAGGDAGVGTAFRLFFSSQPVANAGADFSVNEGQLVTLDGTGSSAPGGGALTYAWVQLPGTTTVTLSGADTATPSFTAPSVAAGGVTLSFRLTVTAGGESATDTVNVTVANVNHVPVADAGPDLTVIEGASVTLDGTNSFDVDNDPITYQWLQILGPTAGITGADTANPIITLPGVGSGGATVVFKLTVDDGLPPDAPAPGYAPGSNVAEVTIHVTNVNTFPTANAGPDQIVNENTLVHVNGVASSDPDGDPLSYSWAQIGGPLVTLANPLAMNTTFTAPAVSPGGADLTFELTVNDGFGGTATDDVVIHVADLSDPPAIDGARPTTTVLPVPNHGVFVVGIVGVSDPNHAVTISITSVTQNEPTAGLGDGDTPIDAIINSDGTVLLRAERSGRGDGRVYHIHFTATTAGGTASGMVTVSVPHDKKHPVIDTGELYDSTH